MRAPFDITAGKHGGVDTSRDANLKTDKHRDRKAIVDFIRARGRSYLKQIVRETGIPVQTASGRLADLKAMNIIEVIPGEREEGCGVVRLAQAQGSLFN